VRLTDQALVAVTIARELAAGDRASVAHLVAGLAIEPDGVAGGFLAVPQSAAAALVERVGAASPRLAPLEAAVGWAQPAADGVPLWSVNLLRSVVEIGAGDLDDHLEAVGYDPPALRRHLGRPEWRGDARWTLSVAWEEGHDVRIAPETLRHGADARLSAHAALAVGRARAQGGQLRHLVRALLVAREDGWPPLFLPEALQAAVGGPAGAAPLDDSVAGAPDGATCRQLAEAVLTLAPH